MGESRGFERHFVDAVPSARIASRAPGRKTLSARGYRIKVGGERSPSCNAKEVEMGKGTKSRKMIKKDSRRKKMARVKRHIEAGKAAAAEAKGK